MIWHRTIFMAGERLPKKQASLRRPILRGLRWAWSLCLLLFFGGSATAAETNAPPATGYQAFKMIIDRNIFNQSRTPGSGGQRSRPVERQIRIETFSLLGTLRYEKGDFAFFDGSSSEYKKVLKPSDTIGGYKIAEIGNNSVKLAGADKQVELPVGMQMKRQDEGEWQLTQRSSSETTRSDSSRPSDRDSSRSREGNREFRREERDSFRTRDSSRRERSSSDGGETRATNSGSTGSSGGAPDDEVLRRLMERRQRE